MFRKVILDIIDQATSDFCTPRVIPPDVGENGFAMVASEYHLRDLFETLDEMVERNPFDKGRVHELQMLRKLLQKPSNTLKLICLNRLEVLDNSRAEGKQIATEVDGVYIEIFKQEVLIHFLEAKNTSKRQVALARKDLKEKLLPLLKPELKQNIVDVAAYGARLKIRSQKASGLSIKYK